MAHRDTFLSWLNDAYAMERDIEKVLESHADDAKDYPNIQSKIRQHLEVTRSQAERVKGVIERLGGDVSTIKTGMSKLMGMIKGASTELAKDQLIKNALAEYATEYFEIASYKSLVAAARRLGDQQAVETFEQIIKEEEEMALWLDQQLPTVTQEMMEKTS